MVLPGAYFVYSARREERLMLGKFPRHIEVVDSATGWVKKTAERDTMQTRCNQGDVCAGAQRFLPGERTIVIGGNAMPPA